MRNNKKKYILLLLPFLLLFTSQIILKLRGPYYLGQNFDPDYVYLLNALNLVYLDSPGHIDHPGTPLQVLGAVVILVRFTVARLLQNAGSLHTHVLSHPESYLNAINITINLGIAITMYFGGLIIYKIERKLTPGLFYQATPFLYETLLISTSRVTPEPMIIIVALWIVAFLWQNTSKDLSERRSFIYSAGLGFLIGLGCAVKVTFLPLVLLAFIFPEWRKVLLVLASAIVSFFVFTMPIVTKYDRWLDWLKELLIRSGKYGGGEIGLPDLHVLLRNARQLALREPAFFILMGAALILLIFMLLKLQNVSGGHSTIRLILVPSLIFLGHTLVTVKHPPIHYMTASLVLSIFLILHLLRLCNEKSDWVHHKWMFAGIFLWFLFAGIFSARNLVGEIQRLKSYNEEVQQIDRTIKTDYDECWRIDYYRASSKTFALSFGNDFVPLRFSGTLRSLYPDAVSYDKWTKAFQHFGELIPSSEIHDFLKGGGCMLMSGSKLDDSTIDTLPVVIRPLILGEKFAVYTVISLKDE